VPNTDKLIPIRLPAGDSALGIAWWNAMTERARLEALIAVEPESNASPAEAWEHWKRTAAAAGFKCEEMAHG
jgi:hypothetical protein